MEESNKVELKDAGELRLASTGAREATGVEGNIRVERELKETGTVVAASMGAAAREAWEMI